MLQIFNFNDQEVRTVLKNNETWFVAKDVADALGYSNTNALTRRLDDDEVLMDYLSLPSKINGVSESLPSNNAALLTESGLYSAILWSEKKEAKAFKKWVTSEVLPSIRKTGRYSLKDRPETLEVLRAKVEALETKYGKPAHLIKPPFLGQSYVTPLQWHDIMYVMHEISHMTINPRVTLDKITTDYFKYCDSHIVTYEHALEYLAEIRAKYEEGYDPALRT